MAEKTVYTAKIDGVTYRVTFDPSGPYARQTALDTLCSQINPMIMERELEALRIIVAAKRATEAKLAAKRG